jgi:FkbM family methyltransferase
MPKGNDGDREVRSRVKVRPFLESCVGAAMRAYRSSPLHPHLGGVFAALLGRMTRGRHVVVKKVRGLQYELDLSQVIDASLYYSGTFEPLAEKTLERLAEPGMVAMDVGANVGYHALPLARHVGDAGLVLAVEPSERAMRRLRRNAELNGLENVRFLRVALGDADVESATLPIRSSYRLDGQDRPVLERVRVRTLDSLVADEGIARLDLLKVDVDGFEARVFAGARRALARFRPSVLFELVPQEVRRLGGDPEGVLSGLLSLGYRLYTEDGRLLKDPRDALRWIGRRYAANLLALPEGPVVSPGPMESARLPDR